MTTKLPTEDRPITLETALSQQVEEMLNPYRGEKLEAAQKAVAKVYRSGFSGDFHALVKRYREAIKEAVS